MHALDWLGDLVRELARFIPRVVLIRNTRRGVRFTLGRATLVGPGLVCYWPLISEVETVSVVRQTLNLTYQSLIASSGTEVAIASTVVYTIDDPLLALTSTDDLTDTIGDVAQWGVKRLVTQCSCDELRAGRTVHNRSIDKMLRSKLGTDLQPYGVTVVQAFLTEISFPTAVRLMGVHH